MAADFTSYENSRFGFTIDLPLDFKTILIPETGDKIGLESADGSAGLSVWGNYIQEIGFKAESGLGRDLQIEEGWKFTYEKRGPSWASFSGIREERILYMRQIALCDDAMGNLTIEYPASQQQRYDRLVEHLVKALKAPSNCV
nr:hypothetical protein [Rhizobium sp. ACO-34A]